MINRIRAGLAANPLAVDTFIALGLTALSLLAVAGGAKDVGSLASFSVALLLLETLPLVFRRKWPIPVLAVTLGATGLHAFLADTATVNESLGVLVALFTVADRYERRVSIAAAFAVGGLFAAVFIAQAGIPTALAGMIQTQLTIIAVWALGDWVGIRRRYGDAIDENARLQDAERAERSKRAVQDERERIARDLHDIVTHHVSVIVIQAGAGLTALDRRPEQSRSALEAIDRTSRAALTDMRRMLGILGDASGGEDVREPVPGLDRLGQLIEEVRAAGLPVELSVTGTRRPLDAGVELSAYRIIQEALTNALKHARNARAKVTLGYEPRCLDIEVRDEGGTGGRDLGESTAGGRGLIGMRERVAIFDGELEAVPVAGGFRVHARLPIDPVGAVDRDDPDGPTDRDLTAGS